MGAASDNGMTFEVGEQIIRHDEMAPATPTGLQAPIADAIKDATASEARLLADLVNRIAKLVGLPADLPFPAVERSGGWTEKRSTPWRPRSRS